MQNSSRKYLIFSTFLTSGLTSYLDSFVASLRRLICNDEIFFVDINLISFNTNEEVHLREVAKRVQNILAFNSVFTFHFTEKIFKCKYIPRIS